MANAKVVPSKLLPLYLNVITHTHEDWLNSKGLPYLSTSRGPGSGMETRIRGVVPKFTNFRQKNAIKQPFFLISDFFKSKGSKNF